MIETAFIRKTNKAYREACDRAHVPLLRGRSKTPAAYLATINGKHRPSDCLHFDYMHVGDVWSWVESLGYAPVPADDGLSK